MSMNARSSRSHPRIRTRLNRVVASTGVALLAILGAVVAAPPAQADVISLSGYVTAADTGDPLQYAYVYLDSVSTGLREASGSSTDVNGYYHFDSVSADGDYTLYISGYNVGAGSYASEYYPRVQFKNRALPIALSNSSSETLDFTLERAGYITGNVSFDGDYHNTAMQFFAFDPVDSHWGFVQQAGIDGSGDYLGRALAPGEYKIRYFDVSTFDHYLDEYYNNKYTLADGDTVSVTAGNVTSGVDVELSYLSNKTVTRLAGANRFDTSARIAQEYTSADTVIVANGLGYPDALSAASAAALTDAPLLLTAKDYLPASVKAEIVRLSPSYIWVIGGTGVVSDSVFEELRPLGTDIDRIYGANRYATSLAVMDTFWPSPSFFEVFLADGRNFPDALSAASAAGKLDGPVALVNGGLASMPADLKTTLENKYVANIWLAGGSSVLSNGIQASAESISGINEVGRWWGADRYATSLAITQRFFSPTIETVYLAVGTGYADALAGAALAGKNGSPLYLVPGNCVPNAVLDSLDSLGATKVVLLGGTGVLSSRVEFLIPCGS